VYLWLLNDGSAGRQQVHAWRMRGACITSWQQIQQMQQRLALACVGHQAACVHVHAWL
jgi:hypothetical protein